MFLIVAVIIVIAYLLFREYLPVFAYVEADTIVVKSVGKMGLYELLASEKVAIPSYNWRTVPTGVTIAPFGSFLFRGRLICLFGNVGCRVYSVPEVKVRGAEVMPYVFNDIPRRPIELIVTNLNPKYPYIARKGEVIAYLEVFRVPSYHLLHVVKEEIDGEAH
jgi:hypothetical protein